MFSRLMGIFRAFQKARTETNWHILDEAKPSETHPLGGFWKRHSTSEHGLAVGPAGDGLYFVSFCGPGGCFEKGQYRPNTALVGDPQYRVIDDNTIEVMGKNGFNRYVRSAPPDDE